MMLDISLVRVLFVLIGVNLHFPSCSRVISGHHIRRFFLIRRSPIPVMYLSWNLLMGIMLMAIEVSGFDAWENHWYEPCLMAAKFLSQPFLWGVRKN